jgi:hypothetical protein
MQDRNLSHRIGLTPRPCKRKSRPVKRRFRHVGPARGLRCCTFVLFGDPVTKSQPVARTPRDTNFESGRRGGAKISTLVFPQPRDGDNHRRSDAKPCAQRISRHDGDPLAHAFERCHIDSGQGDRHRQSDRLGPRRSGARRQPLAPLPWRRCFDLPSVDRSPVSCETHRMGPTSALQAKVKLWQENLWRAISTAGPQAAGASRCPCRRQR